MEEMFEVKAVNRQRGKSFVTQIVSECWHECCLCAIGARAPRRVGVGHRGSTNTWLRSRLMLNAVSSHLRAVIPRLNVVCTFGILTNGTFYCPVGILTKLDSVVLRMDSFVFFNCPNK